LDILYAFNLVQSVLLSIENGYSKIIQGISVPSENAVDLAKAILEKSEGEIKCFSYSDGSIW
jgi:hypothetical protein